VDKFSLPADTVQSPLSSNPEINGEHRLSELPLCGKINLRGDSGNKDFCEAIETVTGLGLPTQANTTVFNDQHRLFWLGPDEWLLHLPLNVLDTHIQALRNALGSLHHAVTDVSDYYTIIQLSGEHAHEVLASGSPFDVRPDRFKPGQCAQTHFGHASILLWPEDEQSYCLQIRWSYAQYLYTYLTESIHNAEHLANFET